MAQPLQYAQHTQREYKTKDIRMRYILIIGLLINISVQASDLTIDDKIGMYSDCDRDDQSWSSDKALEQEDYQKCFTTTYGLDDEVADEILSEDW